MFGGAEVRLRARHDHLRQGHDQRLLADRRHDRHRPAVRAVQDAATRCSPTATPSAATRCPPAVALANLDIFEREDLLGHVHPNEPVFRATLEQLLDLPIVGDVRGAGYFWGIELVKDKATKETFNAEESERLLRGFLSQALFDAGLYCRADDRGDPVIQLAPPLICGPKEFDEIESILRSVLTEAWARLDPCPVRHARRTIISPKGIHRHEDRRARRGQEQRVPRRRHPGGRARAGPPRPRGPRRARRGPRLAHHGRGLPRRRGEDPRHRRRGVGRGRHGPQGQGADRRGVPPPAARTRCSSPTCTSPPTGVHRRPDRRRHHRHRLRDRPGRPAPCRCSPRCPRSRAGWPRRSAPTT